MHYYCSYRDITHQRTDKSDKQIKQQDTKITLKQYKIRPIHPKIKKQTVFYHNLVQQAQKPKYKNIKEKNST